MLGFHTRLLFGRLARAMTIDVVFHIFKVNIGVYIMTKIFKSP